MNTVLIMMAVLAVGAFICRAVENRRERHWEETVKDVNDGEVIWPVNEIQAKAVAERNTGIMMQAMRDLGCQPEKEKDDPYAFRVKYQGETFTISCDNPYIWIFDLAWSYVDVKNPEFPTINEAMNAVNFNGGPKVVMTDADENGHRFFHSHTSFLLYPGFSQNTEFMKQQLASFFFIKEEMQNAFHKLKAEQQEMTKNRKPVGFKTGVVADTEDKTAT